METDREKVNAAIDEWNKKQRDLFSYISLYSINNLVLDGQYTLRDLKEIVAALEELQTSLGYTEDNA